MGARTLATGKKNAQKLKAWLCFVDESGFSQRPPIRATWAPRGQTPRVVEPFNWQRFSGIAALLTRPDGQRPRWLLALHRGSVRSAQVVRFLQSLRRHRRQTAHWIARVARRQPLLFAHWGLLQGRGRTMGAG